MHSNSTLHTSRVQKIFRVILGSFLLIAGTGHLSFARTEFQAQVPVWLPMDKDFVVVASGFVEIALGLSIIMVKRYRSQLGWVSALFFVAVFPGNLSQYQHHLDGFGLDTDSKRFARLFFQPVLIAWALWSMGSWAAKQYKLANV